MLEVKAPFEIKEGHQTFGSGCYRAGWELVEGEVEKKFVRDESDDFIHCFVYELTPKGEYAIIRLWEKDIINRVRYFGPQGLIKIVKGEN